MLRRRFRRQKFTFLDYWLDRFVHVMVHMLALDSGIMASSLLAFHARLGIVILLVLVIEATLDLVGIVVLERAMLNRGSFVMVLLGQDFRMGHRLFRGVVMVLMHLPVYCGSLLFMFLMSDGFVLDRWSHPLVNSCVMFTVIRPNQVSIDYIESNSMTLRT
jgi:hypothetical protein